MGGQGCFAVWTDKYPVERKGRILRHLDVLLEARNIDIVWMGGCEWIAPPMASTELYNTLVQEYEHEIIDRMHAGGALSHIHWEANSDL